MAEIGYDLTQHHSKSLDEIKQFAPFNVVVTMGCGDACPWMPAERFVDWNIPDPKEMNAEDFKKVRSLIKASVEELISSL
jgi:protein-tyrosine-phosphatase